MNAGQKLLEVTFWQIAIIVLRLFICHLDKGIHCVGLNKGNF